MRWDARGTMALLVAALVGVTAGVIVGFTTGTPGTSSADKDTPSNSPSPSGSPNDPLRLGAPLVNLECTGQHILVVGWGETSGALVNAVSANLDADVKYLETAKSCNTLYGAEKQPKPKYAVYLGPFDSIFEPCSLRMGIDHNRDVVTNLKNGVKIHVQCLCALRPADLPRLTPGMVADTHEGIFIRALQRLLVDLGLNPTHYITGEYNERTAKMIVPLQRINAIDPRLYGIVEKQTWLLLRDRGCLQYDF
jgi:hypothetical protein